MNPAKELLDAIRAHKLTQAAISEETGIPQPTISKIERDEVSDVMSKSYIALQQLLARLEAKKKRAHRKAQSLRHGSDSEAA